MHQLTQPTGDRVRAWRPRVAGVAEVLHAEWRDHSYPAHTHDTWTLLLVDDGLIGYELDRRDHAAVPRTGVTLLPPHVVHDGRPATSRGFRKQPSPAPISISSASGSTARRTPSTRSSRVLGCTAERAAAVKLVVRALGRRAGCHDDGVLDGPLADDSPRGRLLTALAAAIVEKGFAATTVADVCRLAKVSRRTFYEHFASREDCYVALLALLQEQLIAHIAGAVDVGAPVDVQVRQAVEAWIHGSMVRPELTLSWIRDSPSLPSARAVQVEAQRRFVALIARFAAGPVFRTEHDEPPEALMIILVGGLRELIATQVESGGSPADIIEVAVSATMAIVATL